MHSTPPRHLPRHQHAFDPRIRRCLLLRAPRQRRESVAHRGSIRHAHQHAADLGLVQNVGRKDLHHHRKPEALGRRHRFLGSRARLLRHDLQPRRGKQPLRLRLARRRRGQIDARHDRRRFARLGRERRAEPTHRGDGIHRPRWILQTDPPLFFQLARSLRRHDHRQHVQPVRMALAHHVQLLQHRRPAARRRDHA